MKTALALIIIMTGITNAEGSNMHKTIEKLIPALIQVESKGDANAVGDDGEAIGILQQHKIFVDEVNRILKTKWGKQTYPAFFYVFTYEERFNPFKAQLMAEIWFKYYLSRGWSVEKCVRSYNAGKNWQGKQAGKYWSKVKAELERGK